MMEVATGPFTAAHIHPSGVAMKLLLQGITVGGLTHMFMGPEDK